MKFSDYFSKIYTRNPVATGTAGDWIAAGCSHTAGYGVEPGEIYIDLVAQHYRRPIHNLALGMSNHAVCRHNIQQWIHESGPPGLIIMQWPNPVRRTSWRGDTGTLVSATQADEILHTMLRLGEQNLYADWLDSIVVLNQLAGALQVPVINIVLDRLDPAYHDILGQHGIQVYDDQPKPGRSWIFDSAGSDGSHHSAQCHQLWAKRLIGIIDATTTR